MNPPIPTEILENKIYLIRGCKVMLDRDLAELYGVETKYLTRQVRRNLERFPSGFLLTLTRQEVAILKCQIGTSSWGGIRKPPFAFTEHGILMLSSVLNSKRAIQVNIAIMKVFVKLRQELSKHHLLSKKIKQLEQKIKTHDHEIESIFNAIRRLMNIEEKPKRRIGFH